MITSKFVQTISTQTDFYAGVPDSQLKPLCDYLYTNYQTGSNHVVCANEGNAVALAAGYYLATRKIPVVYLQNSGIGNIVNPVASLLHPDVYGIPCIFIVGWRGEPGQKDEPQHAYQGKVTLQLLTDLDIAYYIVDQDTTEYDLQTAMKHFTALLSSGKSVAFVIKKGALSSENIQANYPMNSDKTLSREEALRIICSAADDGVIVSTTGKISRELWEIRESTRQSHCQDFLTVGSMGHASSIAAGIALHAPKKNIWCLDGDGAALMHMGAMAIIGSMHLKNFIHIVLNNCCHESVGGMPTVAGRVSLTQIASGCGYQKVFSTDNANDLHAILSQIKVGEENVFLEVLVKAGSREDLGRPKESPQSAKNSFMSALQEKG